MFCEVPNFIGCVCLSFCDIYINKQKLTLIKIFLIYYISMFLTLNIITLTQIIILLIFSLILSHEVKVVIPNFYLLN